MKNSTSKKMTLEKLASLTQAEFLAFGKKFATKEDLESFATKEDLESFATKEDLESFKREIKEDMREFKEEVKENMDKNMGKFLTKADAISKKLDYLIDEDKAGSGLYKRHDKILETHEKRISALESANALQ